MYPFEYHGSVIFNSNPQLFDLRFKKRLHNNGYLWNRNQWQGGRNFYTGTATAGRGATLAGLAEMITGDGNDWRELSKTESVNVGQIIQINPLLKKLE